MRDTYPLGIDVGTGGGLARGGGRAHERIPIQAGYHLAGVVGLIGEPDDPEHPPQTADLHARILTLAESHQVFDPSADFEVAIRGEADAS